MAGQTDCATVYMHTFSPLAHATAIFISHFWAACKRGSKGMVVPRLGALVQMDKAQTFQIGLCWTSTSKPSSPEKGQFKGPSSLEIWPQYRRMDPPR
ncbi:hypothetical protein HYQ44_012219 [Verticillium longisporum]|nr:hypothetical protein HYQ44_012219 [Verticillium longisporum]